MAFPLRRGSKTKNKRKCKLLERKKNTVILTLEGQMSIVWVIGIQLKETVRFYSPLLGS